MLFFILGLTSKCSMSQAFTIRSLIPCLACRMPSWQHLTRRCSFLPFNPSISKISWRHDVQLSATSLPFSIPRSKSDHFFEGDRVVIQNSSSALDPLALFQCSLVSRDSRFPSFPQLWLRSDRSVPSRAWFLSRLHHFFPWSIGGHSM